TDRMLEVYADVVENYLAIPVIKGHKSESEKFAGAEYTLAIETLMHDGKALQAGTSHLFGDGVARAFDITYLDKEGKEQYVHQTSWGVTTRLIGALIMVHGDNRGLVVPPRIAPTQLHIIPIAQHKEGVLDKAYDLKERLEKVARVDIDASDNMPGWKFNESEMKGYPLRLEVGPRDIEKEQVVLVRRDTGEKEFVPMADLEARIPELLEEIQANLFEKARLHRDEMTTVVTNMEELTQVAEEKQGFMKAMWCGDVACEEKIQDAVQVTSRCIPFEQEKVSETCVCCDQPAEKLVYWAKAY